MTRGLSLIFSFSTKGFHANYQIDPTSSNFTTT